MPDGGGGDSDFDAELSGRMDDNGWSREVRRLVDVFNEYGSVRNVTQTTGRTTIDFSLGVDEDLSLLQRAKGGRFGSSVVVNTRNGRILTATLRYGSLDLPDGADEFIATSQAAKTVEDTNPPMETDVRLRQMGGDILHVTVEEQVGVGAFADWFHRLDPAIRDAKPEIREFTINVSGL